MPQQTSQRSDLAAQLDSLVDEPRRKPGPGCSVGRLLGQLDDKDGAALRKVIDNDQVAATRIAERLTAAGHRILPQTVIRHRRRGAHNGCACAA